MTKQWLIKTPNPQAQVKLSDALGIHPLIAQLLVNRGVRNIKQARNFLTGDYSSLHDPFLLKDMDKAVRRIRQAQKKKEQVLVFGDYDVDGITSSAILKKVLTALALDVINYIPHRIDEGYGLNHTIAAFAKKKGIHLLIAIDCGINAVSEVESINDQGIDVIILDHHEPPEDHLPKALAIVNPRRKDCTYPFKDLASAGLAFKLAHALLGKVPDDFMDLVALGTIADVADLTGENRIFVKEGLKRIEQTKNQGLLALMHTARIKDKKIKPTSVGFILGPRINATGRLGSAEKALELLLCDDFSKAMMIAESLEGDNRLRQKTQKEIADEALSMVEQNVNFKDHRVIVVSKEGWHPGVVGIVAARLMDTFYRPAIVISLDNGIGKGSARSIESFHIYEALHHCAAHLENFGGHEHAAGLTIKAEKIDSFSQAMNEYASRVMDVHDLVPTLEVDSEIPLAALDLDLAKAIEAIEPCGEGNPTPVFCSRRLSLKGSCQIAGRETIKFWATDGQKAFSCVGFGMAGYADCLSQAKEFDCAYQVMIDDYNKDPQVQLKIKDIKIN
ncbi:MAG: single-stranded-DNA-specific exonuclease RecJ [Candidatus Omnitrophota bacterium]